MNFIYGLLKYKEVDNTFWLDISPNMVNIINFHFQSYIRQTANSFPDRIGPSALPWDKSSFYHL